MIVVTSSNESTDKYNAVNKQQPDILSNQETEKTNHVLTDAVTPPFTTNQHALSPFEAFSSNGATGDLPGHPEKTTNDSAKKEKNNGLVNHGNTCYVAAAVQSMLALPNVRREAKTGPLKLLDKAIFTKDIHQSIQNGLTVQGFGDLLAELNNVADEFGNKYKHFLPFEQNDSFQLVQQIFQVKKYSKIKDLFSFDTYDELACDRCSASRKLEPKINMEVIISPNKRIQNALEAYFSCPEIIECDCTDCGSKIMRKSTHLLNPPECLLIVTQSFDVTGRKQPTLEHAEPYSEVVALPHKSENAIYELKSMVVHSGLSNTSGHFIANIKNGDVWLRADDDKVTAGSEPEIRSGETVYMQLFQKISGF